MREQQYVSRPRRRRYCQDARDTRSSGALRSHEALRHVPGWRATRFFECRPEPPATVLAGITHEHVLQAHIGEHIDQNRLNPTLAYPRISELLRMSPSPSEFARCFRRRSVPVRWKWYPVRQFGRNIGGRVRTPHALSEHARGCPAKIECHVEHRISSLSLELPPLWPMHFRTLLEESKQRRH